MITLTREEAQQVLNELSAVWKMDRSTSHDKAMETLRAQLAQPEPELVVWKELTTAECKMLWRISEGPRNFAEMLQAKLREKNG